MTTVINTPTPVEKTEGSGFLISMVLLIVFVGVLLYFGIPAVQRMRTIQVNVPASQINVPAPQVNMPDKVEVAPAK